MSPLEIRVSIAGEMKNPMKVADGVLAQAKTPAGEVLAFVLPDSGWPANPLYDRFGFLFPDMPPSNYDTRNLGITGHGLYFGSQESLFTVFSKESRRRRKATKIIYSKTYPSSQGEVKIEVIAKNNKPKGKKAEDIVLTDFRPVFVPV